MTAMAINMKRAEQHRVVLGSEVIGTYMHACMHALHLCARQVIRPLYTELQQGHVPVHHWAKWLEEKIEAAEAELRCMGEKELSNHSDMDLLSEILRGGSQVFD